jgi:hypothetical protein
MRCRTDFGRFKSLDCVAHSLELAGKLKAILLFRNMRKAGKIFMFCR